MSEAAKRGEWSRRTLRDVGDWRSGGTPSKARADYWNGSVPWVSPKDMKVFALHDAQDSITERAVADGARIAPEGTVFVVVRGMILAHTFPVCVATRSLAFNQDVKAIVPAASVSGRFLAHWMVGRSDALLRIVTEATHGTKRIELRDLLAHAITVPPLTEQQRIAEILDTVDEAIRKTEEIIAKLKQVKQGLLHDLLTRGIDDNGELRDPDRHPEQFKDSPLGRIPKEWNFEPLGAHLARAPQNGLYKPSSHYGEQGTPIVRIDGFYDSVLAPVSTMKRVRLTDAERSAYHLRPGDILVNRVNSIDYVGKVGLVPRTFDAEAVFESNIMRIALNGDLLRPEYASLRLCAEGAKRHFFRRAKSAIAQASINQTDVLSCPLAVPSPDEQDAIVARVGAADARIGEECAGLDKLRLLKQGLMNDLLTGRVRTTSLVLGAER